MAEEQPILDILQLASDIVVGGRQNEYGAPERSTETIAALWTTLLQGAGVLPAGSRITGDMTCLMMAALKLARLSAAPEHIDSQVDTCGYIALMRLNQKARAE